MSKYSRAKKTRSAHAHKQRGMALIMSALLSVVVMSGILFMDLQSSIDEKFNANAAESGRLFDSYNAAIRKMISNEGAAINVGIFAGVNWLKGIGCAPANPPPNQADWATDDYLPCTFPETTTLGQAYATNVIIDAATGRITATSTLVAPEVERGMRGRMGAIQALVRRAAASGINNPDPTIGTFVDYTIDRDPNSATFLAVIGTVSNNPSMDAWLRTDGSNAMGGALDMSGFNIDGAGAINANNISATSIAASSNLSIGSRGGVARPVISFVFPGGNNNSDLKLENSESGKLKLSNNDDSAILEVKTVETSNISGINGSAVNAANGLITPNITGLPNGNGGTNPITAGSGITTPDLYLSGIKRYASQGFYYATIANNRDSIQYPIECRDNGMVAQPFASVSSLILNPFEPFAAFHVTLTSDSNDPKFTSKWRVDVTVLDANGGLISSNATTDGSSSSPLRIQAKVLVMVKCT